MIVFEHVPTESAYSADKIKFLEKNIAYTMTLKLHDAGQRIQLEVLWSVRPY